MVIWSGIGVASVEEAFLCCGGESAKPAGRSVKPAAGKIREKNRSPATISPYDAIPCQPRRAALAAARASSLSCAPAGARLGFAAD